jgi:hypothetical protein
MGGVLWRSSGDCRSRTCAGSFTLLYPCRVVAGRARAVEHSGKRDAPTRQPHRRNTTMLNLKTSFIAGSLALASIGAFAQTAPAAAPTTPRIDQREANQQARIAQGAASGELNARETNRLEKQQAHINNAEAKAKADGTVTRKERKHLKHMENKTSKNIYEQKHDAQVAPKP